MTTSYVICRRGSPLSGAGLDMGGECTEVWNMETFQEAVEMKAQGGYESDTIEVMELTLIPAPQSITQDHYFVLEHEGAYYQDWDKEYGPLESAYKGMTLDLVHFICDKGVPVRVDQPHTWSQ
jgi:hypothetical protein